MSDAEAKNRNVATKPSRARLEKGPLRSAQPSEVILYDEPRDLVPQVVGANNADKVIVEDAGRGPGIGDAGRNGVRGRRRSRWLAKQLVFTLTFVGCSAVIAWLSMILEPEFNARRHVAAGSVREVTPSRERGAPPMEASGTGAVLTIHDPMPVQERSLANPKPATSQEGLPMQKVPRLPREPIGDPTVSRPGADPEESLFKLVRPGK